VTQKDIHTEFNKEIFKEISENEAKSFAAKRKLVGASEEGKQELFIGIILACT
jgi:hypothetical protein